MLPVLLFAISPLAGVPEGSFALRQRAVPGRRLLRYRHTSPGRWSCPACGCRPAVDRFDRPGLSLSRSACCPWRPPLPRATAWTDAKFLAAPRSLWGLPRAGDMESGDVGI